jgi:L-fuculose-phosphate aldolase
MNNQEQIIHYTRELFLACINNGANGNFSFRDGNKIWITRSGAISSELGRRDFVEINSATASSENPSHQIIYQNFPEIKAVFHTHSPAAIALSLKLKRNKIIPLDLEGKYYFKEIPIITTELKPGAKDLPKQLLQQAEKHSAVIVRRHGVFVFGKSIPECYTRTITVNNICQIIILKN